MTRPPLQQMAIDFLVILAALSYAVACIGLYLMVGAIIRSMS